MELEYTMRGNKRGERQKQAEVLRDAAITLLRQYGLWAPIANLEGAFLQYNGHEFSMIHVSPFQRIPEPSDEMKYKAAQVGAEWQREPYMLDVWSKLEPRKVFSIRWDFSDALEIIAFRRGSWEQRLLQTVVEVDGRIST